MDGGVNSSIVEFCARVGVNVFVVGSVVFGVVNFV